mmetsp:Transcript_24353/g.70062  ORF Transcript_24353/g.70062 Transcript_24353/m.70062 type:complete len:337 (-) Transcript_24353:1918-2928(-)
MTQFTAQEIVLSFLFPSLGILTGLSWFASPIKAVQEANRRGTLGDLNPTPWSMMLGNCIGWVCYAYLYVFRWYATRNPVDLAGAITLLIPNATGLVLSVWFNLCASKLQYHSGLAKELRSSVAEFVVRHEEDVRRQSMVMFREDIDKVGLADLEGGGMVCEEKKDAEDDVLVQQSQPKGVDDADPAGDANDDRQNRLVEVGKLIVQVTTQEREIPSPHEKTTTIITAFWLIILSLAAFLPFSARQRELFIGIVVNCNLVFFYAAPLSTIAKVLKTRNSASIHIPSMATATFNGIFWGGFGIATKDLVIAVPNTLGAGLGFVQVALCFLFPRKEAAE